MNRNLHTFNRLEQTNTTSTNLLPKQNIMSLLKISHSNREKLNPSLLAKGLTKSAQLMSWFVMFFAVIAFASTNTSGQNVASVSVVGAGPFTPGSSITVNYTLAAALDVNAFLTLELSTPAGAFPGTVLSTLAPGVNPGSFMVTIPAMTASTTMYRVRVTRNGPVLVMPNSLNSAPFAIVNPVISSTACVCNNNQTPNMQNGTFATTLVIRYDDNSPIPMGQTFTVVGTTGIQNTMGGAIGTPTFTYCNGGGCPPGVSNGQYYLNVWVQNNGMYSVNVDGPDAGALTDITLANTTCGVSYPALPVIPTALSPNAVCIETTATFPSAGGRYSFTNNYNAPSYLNGFSQPAAGNDLTINIDNISGTQVFPQTIFLINENTSGCRTASSALVSVFREPTLTLQGGIFNCVDGSVPFNLNQLITASSSNTGTYSVNGMDNGGPNFTVPAGGFCGTFTYAFTDPNCGPKTQTVDFQLTTIPKPTFDITGINEGEVRCLSTGPIDIGATRTSAGPNAVFQLFRNNALIDGAWDGTETIPVPAPGASFSYRICLIETNDNPATCNVTLPGGFTPCTVTVCKSFSVYNDGFGCGANNVFPDQCIARAVNVCDAQASPLFTFGCSFFSISIPFPFATTQLTTTTPSVDCSAPTVSFTYNADVLSLNSAIGGGGTDPPKKIRELSAATGVICDVVCFSIDLGIFGEFRPFGTICDFLGCDKTIVELILSTISNLVQSDGGGILLVVDTDGDGAFDYTAVNATGNEGIGMGTVSVPNNVKGKGKISARVVNGWPLYPTGVCGNVNPSGSDLLTILPFGLIPIAGPIIVQILATASCNANLAWSSFADASVQVNNVGKPTLVNCNTNGYAFEANGACNVGVNWSIPVAFSSCDNQPIPFQGYINTVDTSFYNGANVNAIAAITGPGIYQTAGPVPGSMLPIDSFSVTYTIVGCNGNPETCTFPVVITDSPPPLVCPNNMTFFTDVDQCTAVVNGLAPLRGLGGCISILNYSYTTPVTNVLVQTTSTVPGTINVPDGARFELGTTTITYTLRTGDSIQMCTFDLTVEDRQSPKAVCRDVVVKLDVNGMATVTADTINGGSSDNCGIEFIQIARGGAAFGSTVAFTCDDIGNQNITLRVIDSSGNASQCIATAQIQNFFEGYQLALDIPEFCLEPFQNMIDFANYVKIIAPDGTNIAHADVSTIGANVQGIFGISGFVPDNPMGPIDPGTLSPDGKYTIGTGTGWITVSYVLSINGQISQTPGGVLEGCFKLTNDFVRIEKLFPDWKGGFLCCDQTPILLGHASWDPDQDGTVNGTIKGTLPTNSPAQAYLTLEDVLGTYPRTVYGEWSGQGVKFADPDGVAFSGDEYYYFDPNGLDGSYSITYTVGDEPCIFDFTQDMVVTCQDLQVALSDIEVCPATWVPERVVLIDLNEPNANITLVVAVAGLGALGVDGAHIGTRDPNEPCDDLVDKNLPTATQVGACAPDMEVLKVVDGRVVIPGFWSPAVRNKTYPITVTTYQVLNNDTLPAFEFGCRDIFTYNVTVVDTVAPIFLNCPKEPIVVDALLGQCESFVNFEYPIAFDTCQGFTKVTQVDETGLKSGSLFPVGLTVLAYSTVDTVGNQNYCEIKVIVQDFRLPPRIQCPANVPRVVNATDTCGARVNGIAPTLLTDNCLPHVSVTYEITGPSGNQLACGFENASGNLFPIGTSTVQYRAQDQPLVLITEVRQLDGSFGMEITNFGPAAVDITCGKFMLKNAAGDIIETFTVPTNNNISTMFGRPIFPTISPILWNVRTPDNILDVGETFTHIFNGDQNGDGIVDVINTYNRCDKTKYCFGFLDYVMDEAQMNDKLEAVTILRNTVCDKNDQSDFRAANPCDTASFGRLNPGLPVMKFSNDTVGLQLLAPTFDMCSFTITVEDTEAPTCIWHDSIRVAGGVNLLVGSGMCLRDTVTMPNGLVDDINIFNMNITTSNAGAIAAYLRGPNGKRIKLFDRICATDTLFCTAPAGISGTPDINVNLNETINKWQLAPSITTAPCTPMGGGQTFRPEQSFKEFYGSQGGGSWVLEIFGEEGVTATLVNWDFEILYQIPFGQKDTVMVNSTGLCDTVFSWIHPILEDNCIVGEMQVDYLFSNAVTNTKDTVTQVIKNLMNTTNIMGCRETRRFRVGQTTVRYTLKDQYGNLNMCSFIVTVNDTENPVFVAGTCNDKQIFLNPGECTGVLLNPPMANDNCKMDTILYCFVKADGMDSIPANINALPIGVYNIVAKARDIYGNIERCIFRVSVIEFMPRLSDLACRNLVNLSLDASCRAEVTSDMILAELTNVRCFDNYCVEVLDEKGEPRSKVFTKLDEGKQFKVVITDCKLPRTPPYNSCWGYIKIERKLGPEMLCPRDTVVYCNLDATAKNAQGKYFIGEPIVTSCEIKTTIWHQDEWISYADCDNIRAQLNRTWYLENEKNERISCVQTVRFRKMVLDSVVFPANVTNLVCRDVQLNPALLTPDNTGFPSLHGIKLNRVGGLCMVSLLHTDERYEICQGTYEILRTWKVRDMCTPLSSTNPRTYVQSIKVNDAIGPRINDCPSNITVSVDAWGCEYTNSIPVPKNIEDLCSPNYTFNARIFGGGRVFSGTNSDGTLFARVSNLKKGVYTIEYEVKDQCLKKSVCSFTLTVVDAVAPVASAKEFITVSLTRNTDSFDIGIAKVTPAMIDNGSYDNCGNVYMEIRRDDGTPSCLNEGDLYDHDNNSTTPRIRWNNNTTFNNRINGRDSINPIHKEDSQFDTDKGQYVKFCCEDIGKRHKVILRVWDDADMNGNFGTAGDNYNETWAEVLVEDKTIPVITCPANVTTFCDRADIKYSFGTWTTQTDSVPANLRASIKGVCSGYAIEYRDVSDFTVCNTGTTRRTYRVKGSSVLNGVSCTMSIVTQASSTTPRLEWPVELHEWTKCTLTEADVLANTVRARIRSSAETIKNNGCLSTQATLAGLTSSPSALIAANMQDNATMPYTILDPTSGTLSSIAPEFRRFGPAGTNASAINTPADGFLEARLRNQPRFNANWKEAGCNVYGRKITIEQFTIGEGCRKWLVKFNWINWCTNTDDGCRTTIFKYDDLVPPVITVCPSYTVNVDQTSCLASQAVRPIATDAGQCTPEGYSWVITLTRPNNTTTVINPSSLTPTPSAFTGLVTGVHKVNYRVTDPCGNVAECNGTITVLGKAPTPYCISVSSAVMKDGSVELWAKDFDKGSFPNCIGGSLYYTFNNEHPVLTKLSLEHYFKGKGVEVTGTAAQIATEYNAGRAQRWIPSTGTSGMKFGCKVGDGSTYPIANVNMTVWDQALNSDFCKVTLTLIDNQGACGGTSLVALNGTIKTEATSTMKDVDVTLKAALPEYPLVVKTDASGVYQFNKIPVGVDYSITPYRSGDYANGVNTLDLVYIQRHILGIKKLDTPYKVIAADVDGDQAVRVSDIVAIRKLILGIKDEFDNMPSWRFVDASNKMENSPWPFNEVIAHTSLREVSSNNDFIAIKIADVDESASAALSSVVLPRSSKALELYIDDAPTQVGDIVELPFKASAFDKVHGFQFTLEGIQILDINAGIMDISADNFANISENAATFSWASHTGVQVTEGEILFTIKAKIVNGGALSKGVSLTSSVTKAEAYLGDNYTTGNMLLSFRNNGEAEAAFDMKQNEPNPFKMETIIAYTMPQAGEVSFKVMDLAGRVIMSQTRAAHKGENTIALKASDIGATGLLYYQIVSGEFTSTRKMLIID